MATTFQAPKGCDISAQGEALWINCKPNPALKGRNKNLFGCHKTTNGNNLSSPERETYIRTGRGHVDKLQTKIKPRKGEIKIYSVATKQQMTTTFQAQKGRQMSGKGEN